MKSLMSALFSLLILYVPCLFSAPILLPNDNPLCKVVQDEDQKKIDKLIKKTPLHFLRLTDGCRHTRAVYMSLRPSGGAFSGNDVELIVWDGSIYRRIRVCDNCPFSAWRYVDRYPYADKKNKGYKKRGIVVCPDGSMRLPDGTLIK